MANRLAKETSPYLLEHANNPVDWYPWGPEALQAARTDNKPILLSIGYSACHWCHVMARESFEDPDTAALINRHFVPIKVDREERPDLDQVYMRAVQGMTGSGGWPMTMFLLPDGTPFHGGTYFPPTERYGMPSFRRVLTMVAEAYTLRKADVLNTASRVRDYLQQGVPAAGAASLTPALLDAAYEALARDYDPVQGGFGAAPKFPQPMPIDFLLRSHARTGSPNALEMATHTLRAMAEGGMYDQLGGGFHRYSVDAHWLVPHFEKMLYDNALLGRSYLDAWQITGDPTFLRVATETIDFVIREMRSEEGGFFSSLDADSEGEEGRYYVWTPSEIRQLLGEQDATAVLQAFDVTEHGNFEGRNILHPVREDAISVMARVRARLMAARAQRPHPHRDEKVLAGWNGLMLRTLADAASQTGRADYLDHARKNARFLLGKLRKGNRLLRSYKDGRAVLAGYLEDQAAVADGLLALYEATFEREWLDTASQLVDEMISGFWDPGKGTFFDTAGDHEALVVRPQDVTDNAVPSGTSMAVDVLLRVGRLLGKDDFIAKAVLVVEQLGGAAARAPLAFGRFLAALDFYLGSPVELALIGDLNAPESQALLDVIRTRYLPNRLLAQAPGAGDGAAIPLLRDRPLKNGHPTAYLCEGFVCQAPTNDPAELEEQLRRRMSRIPGIPGS